MQYVPFISIYLCSYTKYAVENSNAIHRFRVAIIVYFNLWIYGFSIELSVCSAWGIPNTEKNNNNYLLTLKC